MKKLLFTLGVSLLLATGSCTNPKDENKSKDTATVKTDTVKLGLLELSSGNLSLKVDPQQGARIVSFAMEGQEVLIQKDSFEVFGSTFWTSPQSTWGWPPLKAVDELPYQKNADGSYESKKVDTLGVTITKLFSPNSDSSFRIVYTIKNDNDTSIKIAPWEITRVASGGTTIFPTENATYKGIKPFGELKITNKDGISLFRYDSNAVNDNKKSFAYASKNWMAQHKGSLLFIKKIENIQAAESAPNESEIEIYANPNKKYIEIEHQGAYKSVAAKSSYTWEVHWYLRKIEDKKYTEKEYQKMIEDILK